jgi:hypothetical protein
MERVPLALMGIGAAWMIVNRLASRGSSSNYQAYDSSWSGSTSYLTSPEPSSDAEVDRAGSWDAGVSARRWANGARDRAAQIRSRARERASRAADRARTRWDILFADSPLVLGLVVLAAGAIVGASLPHAQSED